MNTIQIISCVGLIAGFFILLKISPIKFTEEIFTLLTNKPKSIRDKINEETSRKKKSYIKREIEEIQNILKITGRSEKFPIICAISALLCLTGASIAAVFNNLFLVPVMSAGFMFIPLWYIKLTQSHCKKDISAELETALSVITTSYLRNEDIIIAVKENTEYLNRPVKAVFQGFLARVDLIDSDIEKALSEMKKQIDNAVFKEWCDAAAACLHDRSLKTTLIPIVSKLSDMRVVNAELETMVFEPRKEFITMQVLVVGNIPLLYFLNKDWYNTLMNTTSGKIVLALCFAAIFISAAFVVKLTQPIEYRR